MSTTKLNFSKIQPNFFNNAQLQLQLSKGGKCSISQDSPWPGKPYPVPCEIDNDMYRLSLMKITCSKTDGICKYEGFPILKEKGTVSSIYPIRGWGGMCYVKYRPSDGFVSQAILPCSETEDTITATLIESECKALEIHEGVDKELFCTYTYMPLG